MFRNNLLEEYPYMLMVDRDPTEGDKKEDFYVFWINQKDTTFWLNDYQQKKWIELIPKEESINKKILEKQGK